jgi:hypothetical protein
MSFAHEAPDFDDLLAEDAARIIAAEKALPPLPDHLSARALAEEMLSQRQIAALPTASDPAFALTDTGRAAAIRVAHEAIDRCSGALASSFRPLAWPSASGFSAGSTE